MNEPDVALLWAREQVMRRYQALRDHDYAKWVGDGLKDDNPEVADRAEAHRAGHAHAAASAWQPIASAPRDWNDVLVFSPDDEASCTNGVFLAWCDGETWLTHTAGKNVELQPTHWMPLPAPPQVQHD